MPLIRRYFDADASAMLTLFTPYAHAMLPLPPR